MRTRNTYKLSAAARKERLDAELGRFSRILAGRPDIEKVIVFGSVARGKVGRQSDLDLIIVQKTEKRFLDRLDEMYRLLVPEIACDILVYTPEEFNELKETSRFVGAAVKEGIAIHAV